MDDVNIYIYINSTIKIQRFDQFKYHDVFILRIYN